MKKTGKPVKLKRKVSFAFIIVLVIVSVLFVFTVHIFAAPSINISGDGVSLDTSGGASGTDQTVNIILLLTVLSVAPSILIMMTSFTRIIIILSFLRNALGTQQMPPNQIMIGLALFITLFIMFPVGKNINEKSIIPYSEGKITQKAALDVASQEIKGFMYKYTYKSELALFVNLSGRKAPVDRKELPLTVVIPAFIISELKTAFQIGFIIFIPFLVIDLVVASTLMSMGMMMLPPVMISLPFKILLFVMVDGWKLLTEYIIKGFT